MNKRLVNLLEPLVTELGYEFVGLEQSSNPKNALLRIYIDRPEVGVTVDDCGLVSREISALMDVEDPIKGEYTLEVSSPGLDRPLFTPSHYADVVGQAIKITVFAPIDGRRRFNGSLLSADDDGAVLEQDGEPVRFDYDNVAKARLVPDYADLMRSG